MAHAMHLVSLAPATDSIPTDTILTIAYHSIPSLTNQ
jgi:hypothetical protein